IFPYNFAPRNWAFCDGQILAISQNTALFSLLGTTYGGDGQTTFALPDLRGRVPLHSGASTGPGLSPYTLGEQTGVETVTLTTTEIPAHNHLVGANNSDATSSKPSGRVPAAGGGYADAADGSALLSTAVSNAGGGQPHANIQPILALNFCI